MEFKWSKGCLMAVGPAVDALVNDRMRAIVGNENIHNRMRRDGEDGGLHITILQAAEAKAAGRYEEILPLATETCDDLEEGFCSLGLGSVQEGEKKAWFLAIAWPKAQKLRKLLGFEAKDFHATVGFKTGGDIHSTEKRIDSAVHEPQGLDGTNLLKLLSFARQCEREDKNWIYSAILHHANFLVGEEVKPLVSKTLIERSLMRASEKDWIPALGDAQAAVDTKATPRGYLILGDLWCKAEKVKACREAVEAFKEGLALCNSSHQKKVRNLILSRLEIASEVKGLFPLPALGKFPRTSHVFNLGAATRDDLILPKEQWSFFCNDKYRVTVEEKIDGANLGIMIDQDWNVLLKNRSHFVCSASATQWAGLDEWVGAHRIILNTILGQRFVLYGEWMHAKHSIHYTSLPGVFIAFDIFDRLCSRFLSVESRDKMLKGSGIPVIRTVRTGVCNVAEFKEDLCGLLDNIESIYRTGTMEGVVLRCDEANEEGEQGLTYQVKRAKLVRADFLQGMEEQHWSRGEVVRNQIRPEMFLQAETASVPSKYPSTPHLPFSPCVQSDDIVQTDSEVLDGSFSRGKRVVITEKLDGGNCCLRSGKVFGRTHSREATHWSFGPVKTLYQSLLANHSDIFEVEFPGLALFGENMTAVHSIPYDRLCSPFYLFSARTAQGEWLSWNEVVELANRLEIPTVPLVFDGQFENLKQIDELMRAENLRESRVSSEQCGEGFVIRIADGFKEDEFERSVAKYVRKGHIQTSANWKSTCSKADCFSISIEEWKETVRPPRSARKFEIFVDLDGTLADFDEGVVKLTGKTPDALPMTSMWRAIEQSKNFFGTLSWLSGSKEMWEEISLLEPTILSGVPMSETNWAEKQKKSWCAQNLGINVPVILCATRDKDTYSGPNRILIDDRGRTKRKWEDKGGIFIHHKSAQDTIAQLRRLLSEHQVEGKTKENEEEGATGAIAGTARKAGSSDDSAATSMKSGGKKGKGGLSKRRLKYRLIVLMGFPGSGKSTFAKRLSEAGSNCEVVCQDELGSRGACEDAVGKLIKRHTVIVDRCNVTREERKNWVSMAMVDPKAAVLVHFDMSAESCVKSVSERENHPTIQTKDVRSISKIVNSFHSRLERPDAKADPHFSRIYTVHSFEEAEYLLNVL